jgi:hypothetical protein
MIMALCGFATYWPSANFAIRKNRPRLSSNVLRLVAASQCKRLLHWRRRKTVNYRFDTGPDQPSLGTLLGTPAGKLQ